MFLGPVGDDPQSVEVKRLGIRPGDRLVVKVGRFVGESEADVIKRNVADAFRDTGYIPPVLLIEGDAEIGVIGPDVEATPVTLSVEFAGGTESFVQELRQHIRKRGGGSAQAAMGGA